MQPVHFSGTPVIHEKSTFQLIHLIGAFLDSVQAGGQVLQCPASPNHTQCPAKPADTLHLSLMSLVASSAYMTPQAHFHARPHSPGEQNTTF